MIGINYLKRLEQIMSQAYPGASWLDKKTSFDFIYEAAKDFASKTRCLTSSQTITTVADQANYALNPDFMEILSEKKDDAIKVVKYTTTAGNDYWLEEQLYSDQLYDNNDTSVTIPSNFSITGRTLAARITGTATSTAAQSGGESNLIDSTAPFASVSAGDEVFNSTQSYMGVVLSKTSSTTLVTAMFDVSSQNSSYAGWTNTDAYVIQPAPRLDLYIDPPPATVSETVTVSYIQRPAPVYSDYGSYNFSDDEAILKYAVYLYKYRDSKQNVGDALYLYYDRAVREATRKYRTAMGGKNFRVSWMKDG